jgi:tRNA threonylcarbamoyladenosine biosynthesis protein TsaB
MSLLLHINTALGIAITGISDGTEILASRENANQKEHSSFLQPAIREMLEVTGIELSKIDAVTVVNGPGSYTGLRVGLAAAKGICFSLQKPLIAISTLEWMAAPYKFSECDAICPVIDARRMEIFTAMYDRNLSCISEPGSMILDNDSFSNWLESGTVLFTGNATGKLPQTVVSHRNARITDLGSTLQEQVILGVQSFEKKAFSDLAYTEPFYIKAFYSPLVSSKKIQ